jgi:diadenosine tetraphosphate (Ap4A) HIT family hydrolase
MLKRMLLCLALAGATSVFATEGVSEMAVQLFGKEEAGKRVTDGAVFIDGQFVRAPYSVTREGNVILVNGRIASRFKVEAKAAAAAAEKAASVGVSEHNAAGGGDGYVSEEEGADIGSDATPTLEDAPAAEKKAPKQTSTIDAKLAKKGPSGIDAKLAAKQKAKNMKQATATGTFNTDATPKDPMALFEEADYTYTPPSKPEAPAVPYVRPAAQKPMAERMAEARKKDATAQQKAMAVAKEEPAAEGDDEESTDVVAVEDFDDLTEEEIAAYTKKFTERRAQIEKALAADGMVLLSSGTSGIKSIKRATAWRFIPQYEELCKAKDASKLQSKWGTTIPRTYLQKMFDNATENVTNMKTLVSRVNREAKKAQQRKKNL